MKQANAAAIWLAAVLMAGCECLPRTRCVPPSSPEIDIQPRASTAASYQPIAGKLPESPAPFEGVAELSADAVVKQVLSRNPSLAQMQAAYQAAAARYPQVTSLDDPMFGATFGPETIHPDDPGVEFASRLEISQKYPWPGKLRLRCENAQAAASAAAWDVDDMRLQLIESARSAFYDYYLVYRALEENQRGLELLDQFEKDARARFVAATKEKPVSTQEVYQIRVEIGRQNERKLTLERMHQIAVARINTLMHARPDAPLPPPPKQLNVADALPDAQALRATALSQRPDLQALANRIAAEEASLALAYKEYYPDFEAFFMYDRFMGNTTASRDLASMLGVKLNLPVRRAKRAAAVTEAEARISERRAQLDRQIDQVGYEVQQAYEQAQESAKIVRLYELPKEGILERARLSVAAARPAYRNGQIPATALIEAQRTEVSLRERYHEAVADYYRRRATLERVVAEPLAPANP